MVASSSHCYKGVKFLVYGSLTSNKREPSNYRIRATHNQIAINKVSDLDYCTKKKDAIHKKFRSLFSKSNIAVYEKQDCWHVREGNITAKRKKQVRMYTNGLMPMFINPNEFKACPNVKKTSVSTLAAMLKQIMYNLLFMYDPASITLMQMGFDYMVFVLKMLTYNVPVLLKKGTGI